MNFCEVKFDQTVVKTSDNFPALWPDLPWLLTAKHLDPEYILFTSFAFPSRWGRGATTTGKKTRQNHFSFKLSLMLKDVAISELEWVSYRYQSFSTRRWTIHNEAEQEIAFQLSPLLEKARHSIHKKNWWEFDLDPTRHKNRFQVKEILMLHLC